MRGQLLTLEDTVEFLNLILNMSLTTRSSSRKTTRSSCFDVLSMNRDDARARSVEGCVRLICYYAPCVLLR
jgi:hypothetical protein